MESWNNDYLRAGFQRKRARGKPDFNDVIALRPFLTGENERVLHIPFCCIECVNGRLRNWLCCRRCRQVSDDFYLVMVVRVCLILRYEPLSELIACKY